jgi:hypothetical protein
MRFFQAEDAEIMLYRSDMDFYSRRLTRCRTTSGISYVIEGIISEITMLTLGSYVWISE